MTMTHLIVTRVWFTFILLNEEKKRSRRGLISSKFTPGADLLNFLCVNHNQTPVFHLVKPTHTVFDEYPGVLMLPSLKIVCHLHGFSTVSFRLLNIQINDFSLQQ